MANHVDWRDGLKSTSEINKYMLDHAVNADCKFRVGPEDGEKTQVFHSHKLILSRYSPVFERMFFGSLPEKAEEIRVTDIQPEIFKLMLTYIYTEEITFSNAQEASEVALAADKYMLSLLKPKTADYLCRHVDSSNVLQILHTVVPLLKTEDLKEAYFVDVLQQHTKVVINQKDFKLSPESLLLLILQQDTLSCEEYELVMAVERWAEHQVAVRKLPDNDVSIRTCLEPLIPHMRFLAMSKLNFEGGPGQSNWLTDDEKSYIRDRLDNKTNTTTWDGNIISEKKQRTLYSCLESALKVDDPFPYLRSTGHTKFGLTFTIEKEFYDNTTPRFVGLKMFSQDKSSRVTKYPTKSKANTDCYVENIGINLYKLSDYCGDNQYLSTQVVLAVEQKVPNVPYNDMFDILLMPLVRLFSEDKYLLEVTCKKQGSYPVLHPRHMMISKILITEYKVKDKKYLGLSSPITSLNIF